MAFTVKPLEVHIKGSITDGKRAAVTSPMEGFEGELEATAPSP
jgi:hypothetical protein